MKQEKIKCKEIESYPIGDDKLQVRAITLDGTIINGVFSLEAARRFIVDCKGKGPF